MGRWSLPLLCGVLQGLSISTGAPVEASAAAAATASAVGLVAGLALVARRDAPLLVLAGAAAAQAAQVLIGRPALPVATTFAAYAVARRVLPAPAAGSRGVAVLAAAVLAVAGSIALAGRPGAAAPYALIVVFSVLLGLGLSLRAARAAAGRHELVMGERLRIARDLHDVVGHGVGAITVQAGAARLAVAAGASAEATRALLVIEETGRAVLREARWMVGLLRDDTQRPRLGDLPELVGNARRSGLDVSLVVDGDLTAVSDDVGEAAYRTVQEALTNVLRHAAVPAATVRVRVGGTLDLQVHDEGAAASGGPGSGRGLQGIRERAAALGGEASAGPDDAGGWTLHARLPARARA